MSWKRKRSLHLHISNAINTFRVTSGIIRAILYLLWTTSSFACDNGKEMVLKFQVRRKYWDKVFGEEALLTAFSRWYKESIKLSPVEAKGAVGGEAGAGCGDKEASAINQARVCTLDHKGSNGQLPRSQGSHTRRTLT